MKRYDQNIVIDLEFTRVDAVHRQKGFKFEIIQIGAVRVNPDGRIEDSFSAYVKPEYASRVTATVQALTGIKSCDVCTESQLEEVLESFRKWMGDAHTRFVAWSESDLTQLQSETSFKGIRFPEGDMRWLDLQKVYPRAMGIGNGRRMSLHDASDWCGIKVNEGNLHGAHYDALLTAELLSSLMTKEYIEQKASLTKALSHSAPASFTLGDKFASLATLKESLEETAAAAD